MIHLFLCLSMSFSTNSHTKVTKGSDAWICWSKPPNAKQWNTFPIDSNMLDLLLGQAKSSWTTPRMLPNGGFHSHGATPNNSWMVFVRENPIYKWMRTRATPIEPPKYPSTPWPRDSSPALRTRRDRCRTRRTWIRWLDPRDSRVETKLHCPCAKRAIHCPYAKNAWFCLLLCCVVPFWVSRYTLHGDSLVVGSIFDLTGYQPHE